jgi:hypothetical protein
VVHGIDFVAVGAPQLGQRPGGVGQLVGVLAQGHPCGGQFRASRVAGLGLGAVVALAGGLVGEVPGGARGDEPLDGGGVVVELDQDCEHVGGPLVAVGPGRGRPGDCAHGLRGGGGLLDGGLRAAGALGDLVGGHAVLDGGEQGVGLLQFRQARASLLGVLDQLVDEALSGFPGGGVEDVGADGVPARFVRPVVAAVSHDH